MYCQKCSLHYPDHLNFCRRCGQTLVRSNAETATESVCCTRCGARGVRGENFCQHCGNRIGATQQETVIGACYHCGTSWRSGWLFCKTCGLDRKRALLLSTSTPSAESLGAAVSQQIEDFPEASAIRCKSCGTEAKPYSKFCEVCGGKLDGEKKSQPTTAPSVATSQATAEAQFARPESYRSSPTVFEPPPPKPLVPVAAQTEKAESASNRSGNLFADPTLLPTSPMAETTTNFEPSTAATVLSENSINSGQLSNSAGFGNSSGKLLSDEGAHAKTVVTPLPPFGGEFRHRDSALLGNNQARNRQAMIQSAVLIGFVVLLIVFVWWWFNRDTTSGLSGLPSTSQTTQPRQSNSAGTTTTSSLPETMIFIPGGKFQMGRTGGDEYETPVRTITVSPFYMARTEVTNQEYQRFVNETGRKAPTHWPNGKFPPNEGNFPVVNVSWDDANDFAKWAGKRLPTETEWEFAARGTEGRLYPWGNAWNPSGANAGRETGGRISEVGRFPNGASPFGVMDMCGNVWEWTSSNLLSYADNKVMAPGKVIRGGAFNVPSDRATTTYRGVLPPERLGDKTGFRLARDAQSNP